MRNGRLATFSKPPTNEDFTSRLVGGVTAHDHVARMKEKLQGFEKQIESLKNSAESSVTNNGSHATGGNEPR